jgi:hypothetical protein
VMFNDDSGIEDSLCSSINVNLSFDIDATRVSMRWKAACHWDP